MSYLTDTFGYNTEEWMHGAPCRNVPLSYTPRQAGEHFDQWLPSEEMERKATHLCDGCPFDVKRACLDYGLANPDLTGILGGTTTEQRRIMRGDDTNCGTVRGYEGHRKRDELPCDDCKAANAEASRKKRKAVAA